MVAVRGNIVALLCVFCKIRRLIGVILQDQVYFAGRSVFDYLKVNGSKQLVVGIVLKLADLTTKTATHEWAIISSITGTQHQLPATSCGPPCHANRRAIDVHFTTSQDFP